MTPKKSPRKSARRPSPKTQNSATPWVVAGILGTLLLVTIIVIASGPVQSPVVTQPLWNVPTQVAATVTEAPATEAPAAATEAPIEAPAQPTAQMSNADARKVHLVNLREVYDSQGWTGWLVAAGVVFDESKVESRQPVETGVTVNGQYHTVVEALVIRATGMQVNWPACVTTDRPNEITVSSQTKQHQPDLQNPSVLYTNVVLNGQGTVYADCSDWGQLDPTK